MYSGVCWRERERRKTRIKTSIQIKSVIENTCEWNKYGNVKGKSCSCRGTGLAKEQNVRMCVPVLNSAEACHCSPAQRCNVTVE